MMFEKARKKIVEYACDRFGKNFEVQEEIHPNIKEIQIVNEYGFIERTDHISEGTKAILITIKDKGISKIRINFYVDIKEYQIIGRQDAKLHKIIKLYLKELGWL